MEPFTLCPNCTDRIPLLLLESNSNINICCDCGYANTLPLHEYLNLFTTSSVSNTYSNKCPIHNIEYYSFCFICGVHFCSFCWEHEDHLQKPITNSNIFIENIIVEISEAKYHLQDYLSILASKFSYNRLVLSSYQKCYNRNNDILYFYSILMSIRNKIGDNYFINQNIESNIRFNLYKCTKEDSTHIISYFQNFIINKKPLCSKVIEKIKDINENVSDKIYAVGKLKNGEVLVLIKDFAKIYEPKKNYCNCYILPMKHLLTVNDICQLSNDLIAFNILHKGILLFHVDKVDKPMMIAYPNSIKINDIVALPCDCLGVASSDKLITIYLCQLPDVKKPIRTLEGHTDEVLSLLFINDKKVLLSNSLDLSLRIWNTNTYQCMSIILRFYFSLNKNILIPLQTNSIVIGYLNMLSIMDLSTGQTEKLFFCKEISNVYSVISMEDKVICGCEKGKIVVIDIITKKYIIIQTETNNDIKELLKVNEREFLSVIGNSITIWKCN